MIRIPMMPRRTAIQNRAMLQCIVRFNIILAWGSYIERYKRHQLSCNHLYRYIAVYLMLCPRGTDKQLSPPFYQLEDLL